MQIVCFIDWHNACIASRGKPCSWKLITFMVFACSQQGYRRTGGVHLSDIAAL